MLEPVTADQMQRDYLQAMYRMGDLLPPANRKTPKELAVQFALDRGIGVMDFFGKTRVRKVAHPRQDCMAMLYRRTSLSMPEIGRVMGGRDHSTVLHGIRASERRAAQ